MIKININCFTFRINDCDHLRSTVVKGSLFYITHFAI